MLGIGDYDKVNRRKVRTREDQVMYMGRKYRRDKKTGYYLCTTGSRRRLHVIVWETEAGRRVPPGCVIHHVNWDKSVNKAENLVCVTVAEHERIHNSSGGREWGEKIKKERGLDIPPGL